MLALYALRLDGKPIAMHLGLRLGSTYYSPKIAFDEGYSRYSPGLLLIAHICRDLREQGVQRYEMLGPRTPWKCRLTTTVLPHAHCYIFRKGIGSRILKAAGVDLPLYARAMKHRLMGDPQALPSECLHAAEV